MTMKDKDSYFIEMKDETIFVDFGDKEDFSVQTIGKLDGDKIRIISQRVIGRAKDFTDKKREEY